MRVEVMEHYGLAQPIDQAGYYETAGTVANSRW